MDAFFLYEGLHPLSDIGLLRFFADLKVLTNEQRGAWVESDTIR
jgi:hypothetical protein